jgi:hypothetical protein
MKTLTTIAILGTLAAGAARGDQQRPRIACQTDALNKSEWATLEKKLVPQLTAAVEERMDLSDGYAFRFAARKIQLVAEWAWYVARCCPAVDYSIEIGPNTSGQLRLRLTGGEGVKEFVSVEFKKLLDAADAKMSAQR